MISKYTNRENVQSNFESYAQSFDQIYASPDKKFFLIRWIDKRFRKSMFLRFRKTIKNVNHSDIQSILDIGCGSGRYCAEFLKMGKSVTGIDVASEMLKLAQELCSREASDGTVKFISGNYLGIKFEEKFDAAVLMGLFDYIEDPENILKKLQKDIRRVILASFPKANNFLNAVRKARYYLFKNCPLYFYSKEKLEKLFICCGFDQFYISESDREYYVKIVLKHK